MTQVATPMDVDRSFVQRRSNEERMVVDEDDDGFTLLERVRPSAVVPVLPHPSLSIESKESKDLKDRLKQLEQEREGLLSRLAALEAMDLRGDHTERCSFLARKDERLTQIDRRMIQQ
jgi:hypothetical protein